MKTLGDDVAASFFYHIEKKFGLPRDQFAANPIEFARCLEQLLGVRGSAVIEKKMVKEIQEAFELPESFSTLDDAIQAARKNFLTC